MNLPSFLKTFCPTDLTKTAGKDVHRGLCACWTRSQIERHLPAGFRPLGENPQGEVTWVSDGNKTAVTRSSNGDVVVIVYHAFASYRRAVEGLRLYYQPRAGI